jgi:hypothetical protein
LRACSKRSSTTPKSLKLAIVLAARSCPIINPLPPFQVDIRGNSTLFTCSSFASTHPISFRAFSASSRISANRKCMPAGFSRRCPAARVCSVFRPFPLAFPTNGLDISGNSCWSGLDRRVSPKQLPTNLPHPFDEHDSLGVFWQCVKGFAHFFRKFADDSVGLVNCFRNTALLPSFFIFFLSPGLRSALVVQLYAT